MYWSPPGTEVTKLLRPALSRAFHSSVSPYLSNGSRFILRLPEKRTGSCATTGQWHTVNKRNTDERDSWQNIFKSETLRLFIRSHLSNPPQSKRLKVGIWVTKSLPFYTCLVNSKFVLVKYVCLSRLWKC